MEFLRPRPIRVQPYFGYRSQHRLTISIRALRSKQATFAGKGRWQALRTMMAQFASPEVPELPITLEIRSPSGETTRHEAHTDSEGFAHFDIDLPRGWPLPRHTSWEKVSLEWDNRDGSQKVEGNVLVPGSEETLGIISDIDDTIIETGITGGLRPVLRNLNRVLAQLPDDRIAVPGADVFYGALGGGAVATASQSAPGTRIDATHRPFFYVSSSPWNLFSYLVAFQRTRKLPLGPLLLRDWGLDRETLGKSSHGTHKRAAIDDILATYPDMRFALIGDDTQSDLTAYGAVVADHPGRIAAVFIRTAGEEMTAEEIAAVQVIEESGTHLWLGNTYEMGQDFLADVGLAHDKDAAHIVETIEKRDVSAEQTATGSAEARRA